MTLLPSAQALPGKKDLAHIAEMMGAPAEQREPRQYVPISDTRLGSQVTSPHLQLPQLEPVTDGHVSRLLPLTASTGTTAAEISAAIVAAIAASS